MEELDPSQTQQLSVCFLSCLGHVYATALAQSLPAQLQVIFLARHYTAPQSCPWSDSAWTHAE